MPRELGVQRTRSGTAKRSSSRTRSLLPMSMHGTIDDDDDDDKEEEQFRKTPSLLSRRVLLSSRGFSTRHRFVVVFKTLGLLWILRAAIFLSSDNNDTEEAITHSRQQQQQQQHATTDAPLLASNNKYNNKNDTTTTTIVHWLPNNETASRAFDGMVRDFAQPDVAWAEACAKDNGTEWVNRLRNSGAASHKYYTRLCGGWNNAHWDPFRTPSHNCSVTSSIRLEIRKNNNNNNNNNHNNKNNNNQDDVSEEWWLKTYDADGIPKTLGGDIWYIAYEEEQRNNNNNNKNNNAWWLPVAVGVPRDYWNGTYRIDFRSVPFREPSRSPDRRGRLTIHATTTCFIGELYPPTKDGWKTGGQTNVRWILEDIDRPSPIHDYRSRAVPIKRQPNLNDFDTVVFFGDSISQQTIWDPYQFKFHPFVQQKINDHKVWVANETLEPTKSDLPLSPASFQEYVGALETSIGEGLLVGVANATHKTALVVGSAAWDIVWPKEWQGPTFESHLNAVEDLIRYLLKKYPHLTVVWRLPYSNHMQNANPNDCFSDPALAKDRGSCVSVLKYASFERFRNLYRAQKKRLKTLAKNNDRLKTFDFFEISYLSSSWTIPWDSIHYVPQWNIRILQLMFR